MYKITFVVETPGGNLLKRVTKKATTRLVALKIAFSTKKYWEEKGFPCYFFIEQINKFYVYDGIGSFRGGFEESEASSLVAENEEWTMVETS